MLFWKLAGAHTCRERLRNGSLAACWKCRRRQGNLPARMQLLSPPSGLEAKLECKLIATRFLRVQVFHTNTESFEGNCKYDKEIVSKFFNLAFPCTISLVT